MTLREIGLCAGLMAAGLVAASGAASAKDAPKTHEVVARVVAVDLQAKVIRTDDGTGSSQSLPAAGKLAAKLDEIPIGRTFKLTLQDSGDGTRQEVIAIRPAKHVAER